jgi:dipeptidase E
VRLYLSSFRLGAHARRIPDLARTRAPRVLATMNALDGLPAPTRDEVYKRLVGDFGAIGADVRELDLRQYFSRPDAIADDLTDCDVIWANGGNAFTLMAAMRQSGFVSALARMLREDVVVYGGHSAGAIVATPTLRGIDLVDSADPADAIPAGYAPVIHWEGMALVSYSIAPHFRSDHPESAAMEAVVRYFEAHGMAYRALRDGEAILVNGGEETLLTL